jgi:hypothetical protein
MIAFIEALKDDTCTPKPAKLNAWVYMYIYTYSPPVSSAGTSPSRSDDPNGLETINQGIGRSHLTKTKKEKAMNSIFVQLHLIQNYSIH